MKIPDRLILKTAFVCVSLLPLSALTLEGRLPGEYFREDNPARFGALMSFHSYSDSIVVLHTVNKGARYTIAQQLEKIARGFKVPVKSLEKIGLIEGPMRWLQYSFHKKGGGGFVYITRTENTILYLVIFNLHFEALARDLPYVDRYLKNLRVSDVD